jgi:hypothetical protein
MDTKTNTVNSNVETLDINIDEIFDGAPGSGAVTLPAEEKPKRNILSGLQEKADFSFADPDKDDADDLTAKVDEKETDKETDKEDTSSKAEEAADILESLDEVDEVAEEEKTSKRGRKSISGISDVFSKLIQDDKIVPFDDDKELEDYTAKDWEELIQANLEEKANQVRRETPKQFFASLPEELQVAARYVADGGQDLKGLFSTLAQVEKTKELRNNY